MTTISQQSFNSIANYLKIPLGKVTTKNNQFTRIAENKTSTGIINIIFSLLHESKSSLGPANVLEEAQIFQWLEYAIVYVGNGNTTQNINLVLKDLNGILSTKTFLVGNRQTIADVFLYYLLVSVMKQHIFNHKSVSDFVHSDTLFRNNYSETPSQRQLVFQFEHLNYMGKQNYCENQDSFVLRCQVIFDFDGACLSILRGLVATHSNVKRGRRPSLTIRQLLETPVSLRIS